MGLPFDSMQQIKTVVARLRDSAVPADRLVETALLGYQEVLLTLRQAEELVGAERAADLKINDEYYRHSFGLGAIPASRAESLWTREGRAAFRLPEEINMYARTWGKGWGTDVWMFETFDIFLAMGCSCRAFDVAPYHGVEIPANLNHPVDERYHAAFDLVVDAGTTEHCVRPFEVLSNIKRMVRVGGYAFNALPLNLAGHGYYNFDPSLLHDFYRQNGFSVEESFVFELNGGGRYNLYPDSPSNRLPANPACICVTAKKVRDTDDIVEPIQGWYSVYSLVPQAYTFGPLVTEEGAGTDVKIGADGSHPVYDAIMANLARVYGAEEMAAIGEDPEYRRDPYRLMPRLESALLARTDALVAKEAERLRGKKAYFWITSGETHARWRESFSETTPLAALTLDSMLDGMGVTNADGLPVLSVDKALAGGDAPIVLFADRGTVGTACRRCCALRPRGDFDLVVCWR